MTAPEAEMPQGGPRGKVAGAAADPGDAGHTQAALRSGPGHDERLRVPLRWWLIATAATGVIWLAAIAPLPEPAAWSTTAIFASIFAAGLITYGRARVLVREGGLRAGRARIDLRFLGAIEELDAQQMREVSGPGADVRAFLMLRPYIHRGVRVWIDDPRDTTPYWLISTRRPAALARALRSHLTTPATESNR